ncbi:MAG: NUDIX domain-containing protein [Rhodobacteraceae bacterium]|nr:NUDIX domain-containing protein [Paracoccaceae bacterium]
MPSFWQGVTGATKGGETLEEAARREIFEETGIAPEQISKTDFSYEYPIKTAWKPSYPSGATRITEYVFCAKMAGLPTLSMEHKEFNWVSFQAGLKMLTFEMNAQSLECVESFLKQRETRM